jgi:uncharacterized membrane protein
MKKQLWLAPFACALSLAATSPHTLLAQQALPDIRSAQPDGKAATIITFDLPGGLLPYSDPGVNPAGIDAAGTVVGTYSDNTAEVRYGFYRLADGTMNLIHPSPVEFSVISTAVNAEGTIIGYFQQTGAVPSQGFIRDRVGNYTTFAVPGATETWPSAINSAGTVAGAYSAENQFGFVRDAEGNITTFELLGKSYATFVNGINSTGSIVGYTQKCPCDNQPTLGFLRDSIGNMTVLDPEGSSGATGVYPVAITDDGLIVGYVMDTTTYVRTGFIRDTRGNYTMFSVPGAGEISTTPVAVDPQGSIVGSVNMDNVIFEGFYRLSDGTYGYINVPNSLVTTPTAIGPQGDVTGYFQDASGNVQGFIRINPDPPPTSTTPSENPTTEPAQ